ncbi:MAG: sporulation protein YabP [Clostridia bacterium]|nr:sporulation protein YabP [Clostridia bacterium]MBQ6000677.1 sporulation protein YabP [Clostridia bacterium]MBQ6058522.1 sporulation protein YabP [Clostridia bacterium]
MSGEEKRGASAHRLNLEGRERLFIAGVEDVVSFDEREILLDTTEGSLLLRGEGMHINKLSVENGELQIEGQIDCVEYSDSAPSRPGFFTRVFG